MEKDEREIFIEKIRVLYNIRNFWIKMLKKITKKKNIENENKRIKEVHLKIIIIFVNKYNAIKICEL